MPLQYCYVHNLQTGKFENVRGVENVLGYTNSQFTLDFFYDQLHPDDRKIVFATTKKNINIANELQKQKPMGSQFNMLCRIKRKDGQYLKIMRYSTIFSTEELIQKTFSICTDVTSLCLFDNIGTSFFMAGLQPYDCKQFINNFNKQKWDNLSAREIQIIELIFQGLSTKDIGTNLKISTLTVNKHRQNILKKTNHKNFQNLIKERYYNKLEEH
ncbi:LuxR C-terminal-related transcriptional regulator [Bacteroidales bacterium]|nr:LuxR C-terminal-related transcriptional regulator [Bacteroidales bacterium]